MNDQKAYLTLLFPKNSQLSFKMKSLPSKDKIWSSRIKIQNKINNNHVMNDNREKYIAFKVMSNASDLIKSYPFVGLLNPDQILSIKLVAREPIFDKTIRIKIISMNIEKPQELRDQYEIMDQFKLVKDHIKELPIIILQVQDFIQSETISYISLPSDRRIPMYLSHISQLKQSEGSPKSGLINAQVSQKKIRDSLQVSTNFQIEQSIFQLSDQQQTLINDIRELNKQIVLFKAKQNITFDEDKDKDDQVKFTLFQLITLAIISLLIGIYISEK
ncbi:unnamed protein product [Paramecium pentaurelia]|uniref:MSP domain-containing protein n=1 Tax=Paramecium pentaurelia TaxID=43138 RepID=A0A8S1S3Y4_9CILI|nr:unnamed protein product [Paramecium pentaurelia]